MGQYPAAVLLDLDDTLISFEGVSGKAWDICGDDFIGRHRPGFSKEELLFAIEETKTWYWGDPIRHKTGRENLIQARRDVVGRALSTLGITDQDVVHGLADQYSACHDGLVHLYPNTLSTLNTLRASGVRLALITNGTSQGQRAKLARFHLTDYFEHILIDQELGFGKPDVRVFQHALSLLQLNSRDVWMVGDNLVWDIQGPQAIGIYAIWHDYRKTGLMPHASIIPDRIITDIGELVQPVE